jgi:hypothetical protein
MVLVRLFVIATVVVLVSPTSTFAQANATGALLDLTQTDGVPNGSGSSYWASWFERSDQSKAEQPRWITPMATTTPRLEQEFRYDILWQQAKPGGVYTENVGNTKGLELIPFDGVEVILAVPPYMVHHSATMADGFGDFQALVKYRMLSADEQHGNYILTMFVSSTFPTGSGTNGQTNAVVTPTVSYGKGYGDFDIQGTFGAGLPTGNAAVIGRTYTWNNTFQYHVLNRLWPEVEVNATWFQDGKNAGKQQTYVTPGLVVGRIPLTGRLRLAVGAGIQIPVSAFHLSEHNLLLSIRLPF